MDPVRWTAGVTMLDALDGSRALLGPTATWQYPEAGLLLVLFDDLALGQDGPHGVDGLHRVVLGGVALRTLHDGLAVGAVARP